MSEWTVITVIIAVVGLYVTLKNNFDKPVAELTSVVKVLSESVSRLEKTIDKQEARIDKHSERLDNHESRLTVLEVKEDD